ncbi:DUF4411 family protein, partial [Methanosarcinaceae archaeon]|nr:DUF4411 family protein [Methanosarcinaceae archaeon]
MNSEKFLIDSNSLIEPFNKYYPFEIAPRFWKLMKENINNGSVILLDKVRDELLNTNEEDDLTQWVRSLPKERILDHRDQNILAIYSHNMDYLNENKSYQQNSLAEWAKNDVADAWLIAASAAYGYTLVTFEKGHNSFDQKNPSKMAKIPEVANVFNVKTINLFDMMK